MIVFRYKWLKKWRFRTARFKSRRWRLPLLHAVDRLGDITAKADGGAQAEARVLVEGVAVALVPPVPEADADVGAVCEPKNALFLNSFLYWSRAWLGK